jgi:4-diphosphocytidyl-2-C-methyl-D-erythritol kinase
MRRQAPAKVNLGLAVQRRRPDGYHDIATLFVKISLADTLWLESTPSGIVIECEHPDVPCDESNLIYRAAAALQPLAPDRGVRIHVHKRIPVAAGLGGGSSDAAAALLGLNTLWELQLTRAELTPYAARLGADVPFFLLPDTAALGEGRGDELTPLTCPQVFYLVLVTPPVAVSTAWVYSKFRFELTGVPKDTTILRQYLESGDIAGLGAACSNDLETVVLPEFPVVGDVKRALRQPGTYGVCMSGSGPSVYALCASQMVAQRVANVAQSHDWPTWVCQSWQDGASILEGLA